MAEIVNVKGAEMNNQINALMTTVRDDYTRAIEQHSYNIVPNSQLQAAYRALTKDDYIQGIAIENPKSVHEALIQAASLGVDLTEGKRQAYLVPRKVGNKRAICLNVGYKGYEAIYQRLGVIKRLFVNVVRENDDFSWSGDDAEKPNHSADWFNKEARSAIRGAYCITYFPDGTTQTITAAVSDIFKDHRDISDSWKSYQNKLENNQRAYPPPWITFEEQMVLKTMVYIASKHWPSGQCASDISEALHVVETQDYSEAFKKYTPKQKRTYDEALENGDALFMWLASQQVAVDVLIDLHNSFPKGKKTKNKEEVHRLSKHGYEIYESIINLLDSDDLYGAYELIEDCSDVTVKMLLKQLGEENSLKLSEFVINNSAAQS